MSPGYTPQAAGVETQDSYEVTVEVCGVPGYRPMTVSLPKQHYEQLIQSLDDLMVRMKNASSEDEIVGLLHEAVTTVAALGVLPQGMSVSQAYHLVKGPVRHRKTVLRADLLRGMRLRDNPVLKNAFCAVYAVATRILGYPDSLIIPLGLLLVIGSIPALIASVLGLEEVANNLADLGVFLWMVNPLRSFNFVLFDGYDVASLSFGLKGLVVETLSPTGAFWGFSGLMLRPFNDKTYFLGFSLSIYGAS